MRYKPETIRWIEERSAELSERLSRYRTAGTGEPVSPSVLGGLYRTARVSAGLDDFERVLKLYPSSATARRTNSSGPQSQVLCAELGRLVGEIRAGTTDGRWRGAEEARTLAAVLGLTLRGLKTARGPKGS